MGKNRVWTWETRRAIHDASRIRLWYKSERHCPVETQSDSAFCESTTALETGQWSCSFYHSDSHWTGISGGARILPNKPSSSWRPRYRLRRLQRRGLVQWEGERRFNDLCRSRRRWKGRLRWWLWRSTSLERWLSRGRYHYWYNLLGCWLCQGWKVRRLY